MCCLRPSDNQKGDGVDRLIRGGEGKGRMIGNETVRVCRQARKMSNRRDQISLSGVFFGLNTLVSERSREGKEKGRG